MAEFVTSWAEYTWDMIYESALLLLFGFGLAGIIRALITPTALTGIFGHKPTRQIFTASLVGVPLPLCSCSVLPVAAQLHRSGLSREGTVSFLISTPETGVDSIALSVKLLGPIFAVVRPVAALLAALFAGLMTKIFVPEERSSMPLEMAPDPGDVERKSLIGRLRDGQVYVWTDMVPELAYYLFWGYVLAGGVAALIPGDLLGVHLSGLLQYAGVILVSMPVYVCATSSTPLAAVFLSLGLLPGAVLTFLLVGPATNLTVLVVQKRILGLRGTIIMTLSIIIAGIISGLLMDYFFGETIRETFSRVEDELEEGGLVWYDLAAGMVLIIIMAYYTGKHYYKRVKKRLAQ